MTKLMLAAAFMLSIYSTPAYALNNVEKDKDKHFAATALISTVSYIALQKRGYSKKQAAWYGFSIAFTVGLLKEATDEYVDEEDMLANALGAAIPLIAISF